MGAQIVREQHCERFVADQHAPFVDRVSEPLHLYLSRVCKGAAVYKGSDLLQQILF